MAAFREDAEPVNAEAEPAAEDDSYLEGNPFAEDPEATRRINLENLKFGRNYNGRDE